MPEQTDCWENLRQALWAKGNLTELAHALYPRSTYAVESWLSGKYRPGRASLTHIALVWPDLADLIQVCQEDLGPSRSMGVSARG